MALPQPFDLDLLGRRRARAARAPERVLHRTVIDLISERLIEVNRTFPTAAVIGPAADFWADALRDHPRIGALAAHPDTPVLGIGAESLDLVIHALALHWSNDPVGALIQMRRALRPDGLMLAAFFGGQSLRELRGAFAAAEVAVTGGLSPRVAPMGELRDLGHLLQRAGFAMPVADVERFTLSYPDPLALMHDLRAMGETNVMVDRHRRPLRRAVLRETCARYIAGHGGADGRIPATVEVVVLTGWAPGPGQPEPRRPGSATTRLADALRTTERPLGEPADPRRDGG